MRATCIECGSEKLILYYSEFKLFTIFRCENCGKFIFHWIEGIKKDGSPLYEYGQVLNSPMK